MFHIILTFGAKKNHNSPKKTQSRRWLTPNKRQAGRGRPIYLNLLRYIMHYAGLPITDTNFSMDSVLTTIHILSVYVATIPHN